MPDQQPYNVYAQNEQAQLTADQLGLQNTSNQYLGQLAQLGYNVNMPAGWSQAMLPGGGAAGGAGTVGTLGSGPGGVPNNWYQQASKDFVGDARNDITGKGGASGAFSGGIAATLGGVNPVAAFRGRSNWRQNQANDANRAAQANSIYNTMQNALTGQAQQDVSNENAGIRNDMNAYAASQFNNPTRQAYYNQIYNTNLNQGLDTVNNAYKNAVTNSRESAADRGLLGGTADTQALANLAAQRNSGAAQVGQAAQQAMQGAQSSDQGTLQSLQAMINSGNPTTQQQAATQLQQLQAQGTNLQQQAQNQQMNWNTQNWLTALNSQGLGNVAGAASQGVGLQYGNKALGDASMGWTGGGQGSGG